ncbi:MAG: hypothetical protein PHV34_16665 [Verrucomicrobiae bacterium]|nr:hypothetical protein [Verrucomicrobiae bacterium]
MEVHLFIPKRLLIFLLVTGALFLPLVLSQRLGGQRELAAWHEKLKAHGEPVTHADFFAGQPAETGASAKRLDAAAQKLSLDAEPLTSAFGVFGMSLLAYRGPGKVQCLVPADKKSSGPVKWNELKKLISAHDEDLKIIRHAISQPDCVWRCNGWHDLLAPTPGSTGIARRWLIASCLANIRKPDTALALENLKALNLSLQSTDSRFTADLNLGVFFSCALVWNILQTHSLNEKQLLFAAGSMEKINLPQQLVRQFQRERLFLEPGLVKNDVSTHLDEMSGIGNPEKLKDHLPALAQIIRFHVWRLLWVEQDILLCDQHLQQAVEAARHLAGQHSLQQTMTRLRAGMAALPKPGRFRHFAAYDYAPPNLYLSSLSDTARNETLRQMTLAAIALERYRLRKKHHPASLKELIPTFLDRIPVDFMDGQTLRYRRNPDKTFTLYSIGENLIDDNGDATGSEAGGIWAGRDIVWPNPM